MNNIYFKKDISLIIILLFMFCIFPSSAGFKQDVKPFVFNDGNILYVGGNGPGNYTMIQDAIDNASDGDTIFVYDDNSPYYESIFINKSINLLGEDKNTTIIDSKGDQETIIINDLVNPVFGVTVNGFTVKGANFSGIYIFGIFCIIENNIIYSNEHGVWLQGDYCRDNIIINNNIFNNTVGILEFASNNNKIFYNYISNNHCGINIWLLSDYNNISYNQISNNKEYGIKIFNSAGRGNCNINLICKKTYHNNITSNNISFNGIGIYIYHQSRNFISKNNFIFNDKNAYFESMPRNFWDGNYWNRTRFLPYPIFGKTGFLFLHQWINFDWHPAKEPYDI